MSSEKSIAELTEEITELRKAVQQLTEISFDQARDIAKFRRFFRILGKPIPHVNVLTNEVQLSYPLGESLEN